MILYRTAQLIARALWRLFIGRWEVEGLEHVPARGPFILVANHQSYVDPVLLQAVVWRPMHTMAKSTQFSSPLVGAVLKKLKSFPVRRFEIDPQAVRVALRHLEAGRGVGVYVEGERTWDGRLQPPRLGTIRLILKAGVPVIPAGIGGAYDLWPRWGRLRRGVVRIRIGEPIRFPRLDDRAEREAALPEACDRLMGTLARLADVGDGPGARRPAGRECSEA